MLVDIPATMDETMNISSPSTNRGFLPYLSDSFPAIGIMDVSHSRYAVSIQEYRPMSLRSVAMVAPHVATIVPSRHAMSIPSVNPIMDRRLVLGLIFSKVRPWFTFKDI